MNNHIIIFILIVTVLCQSSCKNSKKEINSPSLEGHDVDTKYVNINSDLINKWKEKKLFEYYSDDSIITIPDSLWKKRKCESFGYSIEMPGKDIRGDEDMQPEVNFNYNTYTCGGVTAIDFLLEQSNPQLYFSTVRFSIISSLLPKMPAEKIKIYKNYIFYVATEGSSGISYSGKCDTIFYNKDSKKNGFEIKDIKFSYLHPYAAKISLEVPSQRKCHEYYRVMVRNGIEHRLSVICCSTGDWNYIFSDGEEKSVTIYRERLNKKYAERFFNSFRQYKNPEDKFNTFYPDATWRDLPPFRK